MENLRKAVATYINCHRNGAKITTYKAKLYFNGIKGITKELKYFENIGNIKRVGKNKYIEYVFVKEINYEKLQTQKQQ